MLFSPFSNSDRYGNVHLEKTNSFTKLSHWLIQDLITFPSTKQTPYLGITVVLNHLLASFILKYALFFLKALKSALTLLQSLSKARSHTKLPRRQSTTSPKLMKATLNIRYGRITESTVSAAFGDRRTQDILNPALSMATFILIVVTYLPLFSYVSDSCREIHKLHKAFCRSYR